MELNKIFILGLFFTLFFMLGITLEKVNHTCKEYVIEIVNNQEYPDDPTELYINGDLTHKIYVMIDGHTQEYGRLELEEQ